MNKIMTAVALAIALPGIAHAQASPAESPRMECCKKMKEKCTCCDKMASKPDSDTPAPSTDDPHAGHNMPSAMPVG